MYESLVYQWLANAVLLLHVTIVLFVIAGLLLVVVGNLRSWPWVNLLWFRLAHLATIGIVAAEAWLGFTCPFTTFEMWLRTKAGTTTYAGGFIEHWLQTLLFWQAPPWVFTVAYTAFGLMVAAAWWYFPPGTGQPAGRDRSAKP
jgi:Protein of Unknown function (DUF2784)